MTTWQFTSFGFLYFIALIVALLLAFASWRMRPVRGARLFSIFAIAVACWIAGYVSGFFNTDLAWKMVSLRVEYLGIVLCPVLMLVFVAEYVQVKIPAFWKSVIWVPSLITLAVVMTFPSHGLLYTAFGIGILDSGFVVLTKVYGPAFYFWMACSYLLMAASGLVMVWGVAEMPGRYRRQATILASIIVLVLVTNILFVTGNNPIAPYDPTPLTFLAGSILVMINMRMFRFLNIVPVAHKLVFDQIHTSVIILNESDSIIDLNEATAEALGIQRADILGRPISRLLPVDRLTSDKAIKLGPGERLFEIDTSKLTSPAGQSAGRIILLHDITERVNMTERQDQLIVELQEALSEVRMLEGMLPICSNCKNIRDDDGQWHELETFIDSHSDAKFSHGICPDCAKALYPGWDG